MNKEIPVILYLVEGCWLCDTALELLNGLKERFNLKIRTVDITSDDGLYEAFRFDIPVVELQGGIRLKGRIRKEELIDALSGRTHSQKQK